MAKGRMITSEIWEDEFFTSLSMFSRLVWIGIITICADDQGRMKDSAALIRSNAFPLDDIQLDEIEKSIKEFTDAGKIERYKVKGKKYIQIINWWKHQTPRYAGKSSMEPPPGWIDRENYNGPGNEHVKINWELAGGYMDDTSIKPTESTTPSSTLDSTPQYVNVNVNDNDNDNDNDAFSKTQRIIERITGLMPAGESAIKAINDIVASNAIEDDIRSGADWLISQGKTIKYYSSLVGPTKTAMARRVQKSQALTGSNPYEGAKTYE